MFTATSSGVGGRSSYTPEVRYISPKSESIITLEGKKDIVFEWKPTPIPAGGRFSYRFELFKGNEYERIADETLPGNVFTIRISISKFKYGNTYTWQVRQRDEVTHNWSHYSRWSFKVERGKSEKVEQLRGIQKELNRLHDERIDERLEKNIP